jgi:hypothetical protein
MTADLAPRSSTWNDVAPDLSHVAGFSPADVSANREGRLSPVQRRLASRGILMKLVMIAVVLVWAAFVVRGDGFQLVVCGIFICVSAYRLVHDLAAVRNSSVARIDGDAWVELLPDSDGPDSYFIHVAGLKLETNKDVYSTLRPGGPYRIYYLPTRGRAVGGEVLPARRSVPRPPEKKRLRLPIGIDLG